MIDRIARLTDYSQQLTVNVGSIAGGGPANRVPHFAECQVNIRAFDEAVLQSAIDAMFALEDEPASVRAVSDGFACRVNVELLSQNPSWPPSAQTDALIEVWMVRRRGLVCRCVRSLGAALVMGTIFPGLCRLSTGSAPLA